MDILYTVILSIHILSAIIGIGSTFLFPVILGLPKKLGDLQYAMNIINKGVNYPKFGSILLLLSGLGMGTMNTTLFKQGWYITAIVLLLSGVLIYVLRVLPKLKTASEVVHSAEGENIPEEYQVLSKAIKPMLKFVAFIDVVIVILMIWKPY